MAVAVAVCAVLGMGRVAEAGRKRVVVLDFEGPKNEKFHEDLVRLIKKTHTVVPTDKWNGAAEQLAAGAVSDKNVKKVARKLKIDAIVEGKIEKRRDEFIIRLKLRAGRSGELVGDTIDTKAEGPRIDGRAQRDLKDELVGAIDNVESNHVSGETDDEDEPVARKARRVAEDDDEDRPAKKPKKADKAEKSDDDDEDKLPARKSKKADKADKDEDEDEEDRPARSGFSKRLDDERGSDKVDRKAKKADKSDKADDEDQLPPKKTARLDDDKPAKKSAAKVDDEDQLPAKKTARLDDDKPAKKPAAKADDEDRLPPKKPVAKAEDKPAVKVAVKEPARPAAKADDDEDKLPPRKPARKADDGNRAKPRKVASRNDDDDGSAEAEAQDTAPLDAATALSPGERVLDAVVGLSMTMRRMTFAISPTLRATPPGYKGTPVPGGVIDATVYPLAFGHKRRDVMKDIGLEILYDRVIKLDSKDQQTGMVYSTIESRFSIAGVFRHAFGRSPTAPMVFGSLGFTRQQFNILGPVDIPDVKYLAVVPSAGIKFPVIPKLILGAEGKIMLIASTGPIQDPNQYGGASVFGYELGAGADYLITPNIFARVSGRFETISYKFAGTGFQTNQRDGMPMTQDVSGATDSYVGGMLTVGYAY